MEKQNIAKINEIFESIQGEGKYLGANQIFVRFAKCNLHCKFCDTQFGNGNDYDVKALMKEILDFDLSKVHSISFTGGEPLMYVDFLDEFLEKFKPIKEKYNLKIYLETNGTLFENLQKIVDKFDIISMDIKLKTATGEENKFEINDKFLKIASNVETYVKVVFDNKIEEKEIENCCHFAKKYNVSLYLQPESFFLFKELKNQNNTLFLENIHKKFLKYYKNVFLIPQVHKFLNLR